MKNYLIIILLVCAINIILTGCNENYTSNSNNTIRKSNDSDAFFALIYPDSTVFRHHMNNLLKNDSIFCFGKDSLTLLNCYNLIANNYIVDAERILRTKKCWAQDISIIITCKDTIVWHKNRRIDISTKEFNFGCGFILINGSKNIVMAENFTGCNFMNYADSVLKYIHISIDDSTNKSYRTNCVDSTIKFGPY